MSVREVAAQAYREALPALTASVVGGLFAGVVLSGMRAELRAVPGLLVLVPALLATRGNVYGALGARLSSGLHQGLVEPTWRPDRRVRAAVAAALGNGILASLFAAVVAYIVLSWLGDPVAPLPVLFAIALVAGLLSGGALTVAVVSVVFAGFERGHNPDTLVGPLVTTTGDVFGVSFLLLAVRLVLALTGGA
ncbi:MULTISPECIES: magnesium transporter [Halorussus]|uniref:magnesium transporter n=1 Tax=Halorussus TaxID=1070314 RepID=UPI0020A0FD50|nr:magnesium transporter [Halorussus vallis]USZ73994.1 magnesium transporter [Halorussus vallis]